MVRFSVEVQGVELRHYGTSFCEAAGLMGDLEWVCGVECRRKVHLTCYDDPAFGPVIETPNGKQWRCDFNDETLFRKLWHRFIHGNLDCVELTTYMESFLVFSNGRNAWLHFRKVCERP